MDEINKQLKKLDELRDKMNAMSALTDKLKDMDAFKDQLDALQVNVAQHYKLCFNAMAVTFYSLKITGF